MSDLFEGIFDIRDGDYLPKPDPAPYAPFPNDLRRLLGKDYRDIKFTFLYN